MAARFRKAYHTVDAYPHFIGVFDTVASLSNPRAAVGLILAASALIATGVAIVYFIVPSLALPIGLLALAGSCIAAACYVGSLLRYWPKSQGGPGFLRSAHITELRMNFYDRTLNKNVGFARHAISIDERRKSFERVRWGDRQEWKNTKPIWFDQTWFAGNHSDIGGSYPDNDAGLSDHSLEWMADAAKMVGLHVNDAALRVFPRHDCMQHDEMKSSPIFSRAGSNFRKMPHDAILHGSVLDRYSESEILNFDRYERYRPITLRSHDGVFQHYIADDLLDSSDARLALDWVRNDIADAKFRGDYRNVYAWQKVEYEMLRRNPSLRSHNGGVDA